jgi:putative tricarboxylic transport membrane protein
VRVDDTPANESQVNHVAGPTASPPGTTATAVPDDRSGRRARLASAVTVPVLLIALSVWTLASSVGLGYWTPIGPGPGFFPMWLAIVLGAMSAIWLVQRVRAISRPPQPVEEATTPEDRAMELLNEEPLELRKVLAVLGSLVAVTALLEVLGFQLSMLLFLLFQLKVLARRRWPLTIALAVLGSFGVFTVFTQLLSVNLPTASIPLLRSIGF